MYIIAYFLEIFELERDDYNICIYTFLFQYGRQNIENVKKKNGTWTENDQDADEENESRHVEKQNVQNWKTENDMQNGMLSSNVIARSTDLILVPEPEMQNHKNHLEETKTESSQTSTTTVNNFSFILLLLFIKKNYL